MVTLAAPIEHARRTAPRRLAIVCGDDSFNYRALHERCSRLLGGLRGLGVAHGDRVAVLAANCHRYVEAHLAVPGGGLVIVPLNTRHAEAELVDAVRRSGARVLSTDRGRGPWRPRSITSFGSVPTTRTAGRCGPSSARRAGWPRATWPPSSSPGARPAAPRASS